MSDVIPIRKGVTPQPAAGEVNPEVVKELEELLDKARAGDITGLAYVSLHAGDFSTAASAGRLTRGVIGALAILQHRLIKLDEES